MRLKGCFVRDMSVSLRGASLGGGEGSGALSTFVRGGGVRGRLGAMGTARGMSYVLLWVVRGTGPSRGIASTRGARIVSTPFLGSGVLELWKGADECRRGASMRVGGVHKTRRPRPPLLHPPPLRNTRLPVGRVPALDSLPLAQVRAPALRGAEVG